MKSLILICLFINLTINAQNMSIDQSRLRVNTSASLSLDANTWKTIEFNGVSSDNINTFGIYPDGAGNPYIYWDQSSKIFRVQGDYTSHHALQIFPTTTTTAISVRSVLQYRIVIPNGNGPGINRYLPYSDTVGYADSSEVTIITNQVNHTPIMFILTATPAVRTNGFYIQMRLSTAITLALGSCTLNQCSLSLQSLK